MNIEAELQRLKAWMDQGLLDAETYRSEQAALLAAYRAGTAGGSALDRRAEAAGTTGRARRKTMDELSVGDEIGPADRRYRLEQFVAQGGMGAVWKATDLSAARHHTQSGRQAPSVALKLLPAELQNVERHKQKLIEEADNARMLGHPNIVRVHGWRECAVTGLPFIEMEYLESTAEAGGDLDKILQREGQPGLSYPRVIELLTPVAQALDYAWNEHQLAHRDIKPGNVFVTADGKVKLLDFGIAARARSTASSLNLGPSPGSPGYRAPEAAANHKITPTLDVYSLAVLIYELLEAEQPFADQRSPHTPWPKKPKSLKPEQWEVLKAGLAFEPGKRPDTTSELLRQIKEAKPSYQPLKQFRDPFKDGTGEGPAMIWLPQGSFLMGSLEIEPERSRREGPQHQVQIRYPLAVGQYPVTFGEFDAFVAEVGYEHSPYDEGWGRGQRPVINVSWNDAQAYTQWLSQKTGESYRLLSEAEWEFAARAGTNTAFWWGNSITTQEANYNASCSYNGSLKGECRKKTVEVHSFQPNPWGLYQVHGNVWEWVLDGWRYDYTGAPVDGRAREVGGRNRDMRVLRGGSWVSGPRNLRAAGRSTDGVDKRFDIIGFRLARTDSS
jgi:formylglycine-generating enzyme required for sulfatase activity